jgi:phage N-6-adenine-methyltransferase
MFDRKDKSYDKDSLQTPQYLITWLKERFRINFDLCASQDNHVCDYFFTKEVDSLKQVWHNLKEGTTGYCNPPYSRGMVDKFVYKAIEEAALGFTTFMVIPELNGERRTRYIMRYATRIIHFDQRVNFIHPLTGKEQKGNNRGTIVVEFSKNFGINNAVHVFHSLKTLKETYK